MMRASYNRFRFFGSILSSNSQRKHAGRWLRSLRWFHFSSADYLLNTRSPWITFDARDFIEHRLARHPRIFEYGSGGSTLFWSEFDPTCLISVEHDAEWYAQVSRRLPQRSSLDYRLIPPERNQTLVQDPADPDAFVSQDPGFADFEFRTYVTQIDAFPDEYFDVVMIDGRARPSCIKHSHSKVAPGGLLILDNAERSYYLANTDTFLGKFECLSFWGVGPCLEWMWRTDIYAQAK